MSGITKIVLVLVILLLGISIYADLAVTFWGDQDWELLVSRMWLDGKRLYTDQVLVTPPLLFYIYALPVFLSQHISVLQDYQALVLVTLLAIAGVIFLCTRMMASHPGFGTHSQKIQWILLLCFLLVVRIRPPFVGDREHIFIFMTLPYLLRWMPGLNNTAFSLRTRLLIGVMASVGFFIKPHCLLLFAGISLVHMIYTRSLRILHSPENITIYVLGILYGLVVWIVTPEYFTRILPMAYYTYSAIQNSPVGSLNMVLSGVLTFIMLRPDVSSPYRKDIYYFTALLPFMALYIVINSGWLYTYQPFLTLLLLTNGFVLWEFLGQKPGWSRAGWMPLLGATLCMVNFALEAATECNYAEQIHTHPCRGNLECDTYYKAFLNDIQSQHARSFSSMGMNTAMWTRVSKLSGATWDTRFPQFWMLPRFITAGNAFYTQHKDIFHYVVDGMTDDLENKKPDLVFVEQSEQIYTIPLSRTLNWVDVMNSSPSFRKAWGHYAFLHTINTCAFLPPATVATDPPPQIPGIKIMVHNCMYNVYKRIP